ncbi:hypothetical protein RO3G_07048 [Rhizopus delemar RA 99-880]|uniref:Uncharacterized protein n=1 Tax=Rhizopus delemar (strain RA 99-880 / ATCC MYA-4621 / FGSC 9543 / NRRL 43880) TaxID=246409 RepID=I1C1L3_RHIO9|nr:hypothetical protein RO3G_07048 [Rhizopus delemar RA 99-880]|eukprot:EIE82343.1 hypothetical protein RO3G_07048 [Rhizopus delemar RA 99-880]
MAASMMKMITEHEDVSQILTCTYTLLLSGTLLVTEIKSFHIILDLFKLALTHKGKITGILDLLIGLLYWIISFLPSCPCPKSAIESWQNWQEYSAEGMDLDKPDTGVDNATRLKLSMIDKPLKAKLDP